MLCIIIAHFMIPFLVSIVKHVGQACRTESFSFVEKWSCGDRFVVVFLGKESSFCWCIDRILPWTWWKATFDVNGLTEMEIAISVHLK